MKNKQVQLNVRIPNQLKEQLENLHWKFAEQNHITVSFNAFMTKLLDDLVRADVKNDK